MGKTPSTPGSLAQQVLDLSGEGRCNRNLSELLDFSTDPSPTLSSPKNPKGDIEPEATACSWGSGIK